MQRLISRSQSGSILMGSKPLLTWGRLRGKIPLFLFFTIPSYRCINIFGEQIYFLYVVSVLKRGIIEYTNMPNLSVITTANILLLHNHLVIIISHFTDTANVVYFSVIGCPPLNPPYNSWISSDGDHAIVQCNDTDEAWFLTCEGTIWTGSFGNCSEILGMLHIGVAI